MLCLLQLIGRFLKNKHKLVINDMRNQNTSIIGSYVHLCVRRADG